MASEPYELGYPVNFYSGGDTTREAFGKHIQEFSKVYGILNSLQSTKADSTAVTQAINDAKTELNGNINTAQSTLQTSINGVQTNLTTHINSSTPHPNLTFDGIGGSLATSRLSGQITNDQIQSVAGSKLTGSVAASLISGALTGATIGAGSVTGTFSTDKISGLQDFVKDNSSLTTTTVNADEQYFKLGNLKIYTKIIRNNPNNGTQLYQVNGTFYYEFDLNSSSLAKDKRISIALFAALSGYPRDKVTTELLNSDKNNMLGDCYTNGDMLHLFQNAHWEASGYYKITVNGASSLDPDSVYATFLAIGY